MRRMFTCQQIPKMMELKALLEAAVQEHPELPAQERGNLLGECDLILSFLMYNDITRMSRLHRSASRQMTRPAVTLRNSGSWTFGSPLGADDVLPCSRGAGQGAGRDVRVYAPLL